MQRSDDHASLVPLFDAIAEAPDDDGPRQVLADALMERGDNRGEFIALQLLRARGLSTAMQESRERVLQENHWRRWFSEVPGVSTGHTTAVTSAHDFHRGFLRSCVLSPCGVGVDSPAWRMIERIDLENTRNAAELAAPALTRLSVLTGLDAECLQVVVGGPDKPRLHELSLGPWVQADGSPFVQAQVLALHRFKSLKVLSLSPEPLRHHADWLRWLFEAPLLRQLEQLTLNLELPFDVAGLNALLVQHHLDRLRLSLATAGVQIVLHANQLAVQFDNVPGLRRHTAALRNLAPRFAPFPYQRFGVRVGERAATKEELARLGEVFIE